MTEADPFKRINRTIAMEELLQTPTISKVSNCLRCDGSFHYTPHLLMGREVFAPRYCEACEPIVSEQNRVELLQKEEDDRRERWSRYCPPIFLETDPERLPAEQWAKAQLWKPSSGRGLLLHGTTGKCKTRIAWLLLLDYYLKHGREDNGPESSVIALSAAEFSRASSDYASGGKSQEWARQLTQIGCLFIDDLGKGKLTERNESDLFDILDQRFAYRRATILTTNTVGDELSKRLDPDRGMPLVRRLREFCDCIAFT